MTTMYLVESSSYTPRDTYIIHKEIIGFFTSLQDVKKHMENKEKELLIRHTENTGYEKDYQVYIYLSLIEPEYNHEPIYIGLLTIENDKMKIIKD